MSRLTIDLRAGAPPTIAGSRWPAFRQTFRTWIMRHGPADRTADARLAAACSPAAIQYALQHGASPTGRPRGARELEALRTALTSAPDWDGPSLHWALTALLADLAASPVGAMDARRDPARDPWFALCTNPWCTIDRLAAVVAPLPRSQVPDVLGALVDLYRLPPPRTRPIQPDDWSPAAAYGVPLHPVTARNTPGVGAEHLCNLLLAPSSRDALTDRHLAQLLTLVLHHSARSLYHLTLWSGSLAAILEHPAADTAVRAVLFPDPLLPMAGVPWQILATARPAWFADPRVRPALARLARDPHLVPALDSPLGQLLLQYGDPPVVAGYWTLACWHSMEAALAALSHLDPAALALLPLTQHDLGQCLRYATTGAARLGVITALGLRPTDPDDLPTPVPFDTTPYARGATVPIPAHLAAHHPDLQRWLANQCSEWLVFKEGQRLHDLAAATARAQAQMALAAIPPVASSAAPPVAPLAAPLVAPSGGVVAGGRRP